MFTHLFNVHLNGTWCLDRPFLNFLASKSVNRHILFRSGTSLKLQHCKRVGRDVGLKYLFKHWVCKKVHKTRTLHFLHTLTHKNVENCSLAIKIRSGLDCFGRGFSRELPKKSLIWQQSRPTRPTLSQFKSPNIRRSSNFMYFRNVFKAAKL